MRNDEEQFESADGSREVKPTESVKRKTRDKVSVQMLIESSPFSKPRAILTKDQALEIYMQKKGQTKGPPQTAAAVARAFGVSEKAIRDIWKGRTWSDETSEADPSRAKKQRGHAGRPPGSKDSVPRRKSKDSKPVPKASTTGCVNSGTSSHSNFSMSESTQAAGQQEQRTHFTAEDPSSNENDNSSDTDNGSAVAVQSQKECRDGPYRFGMGSDFLSHPHPAGTGRFFGVPDPSNSPITLQQNTQTHFDSSQSTSFGRNPARPTEQGDFQADLRSLQERHPRPAAWPAAMGQPALLPDPFLARFGPASAAQSDPVAAAEAGRLRDALSAALGSQQQAYSAASFSAAAAAMAAELHRGGEGAAGGGPLSLAALMSLPFGPAPGAGFGLGLNPGHLLQHPSPFPPFPQPQDLRLLGGPQPGGPQLAGPHLGGLQLGGLQLGGPQPGGLQMGGPVLGTGADWRQWGFPPGAPAPGALPAAGWPHSGGL